MVNFIKNLFFKEPLVKEIEAIESQLKKLDVFLSKIIKVKVDDTELKTLRDVYKYSMRTIYSLESVRDEIRIIQSDRKFKRANNVIEIPQHIREAEDKLAEKMTRELEELTKGKS